MITIMIPHRRDCSKEAAATINRAYTYGRRFKFSASYKSRGGGGRGGEYSSQSTSETGCNYRQTDTPADPTSDYSGEERS